MSNLQHVAEIVEHGGSLSVIRAAHPQFEIDALEVGAKIYIEAQVDLLQAENAKLRKVAIKLYNLGYHSGHEHTVEGCYTHIYQRDMYEYHDDVVADILKDEGVTV